MVDSLEELNATDPQYIHTTEEHDIQYWMDVLEVSREQLADALCAVGNSVEAVREYLGKP